MIGALRGQVLDRQPNGEIIVDVGGVGYLATVTTQALSQIRMGDEVQIYTHHRFGREGDQKLFGFLTRNEVQTFETLLITPGVGPSLALAILNTYPPDRLAVVLDLEDLTALCEVPGVGKKTGQRIMVELRNKLVVDLSDTEILDAGESSSELDDVRDGLAALGYSTNEINDAVKVLDPTPDDDANTLLKRALRVIAGD